MFPQPNTLFYHNSTFPIKNNKLDQVSPSKLSQIIVILVSDSRKCNILPFCTSFPSSIKILKECCSFCVCMCVCVNVHVYLGVCSCLLVICVCACVCACACMQTCEGVCTHAEMHACECNGSLSLSCVNYYLNHLVYTLGISSVSSISDASWGSNLVLSPLLISCHSQIPSGMHTSPY